MKITKLIIVVLVVLGLAFGIYKIAAQTKPLETPESVTPTTSVPSETVKPDITSSVTPTTTTTTTTTTTKPSGYTMADIAKHATSSDCWTTVNSNVYNVTSWINRHPGGAQAILRLCGADGSDAFNGKHGGQARPQSELASFLIGALIK